MRCCIERGSLSVHGLPQGPAEHANALCAILLCCHPVGSEGNNGNQQSHLIAHRLRHPATSSWCGYCVVAHVCVSTLFQSCDSRWLFATLAQPPAPTHPTTHAHSMANSICYTFIFMTVRYLASTDPNAQTTDNPWAQSCCHRCIPIPSCNPF